MSTKEAPRTFNEYTRLHERSSVAGDSLRSSLLSAEASRDAVIPENTFAIRCDSRQFSEQTVAELSHWVDEEREYRHQKSTTGHMDPTAWEARSVASLDSEMKYDRIHGKTPSDITVLYERNTSTDKELHIPSAIIVHKPMSAEEILRIREVLPYGVPILDGETNELLDDVGRTEREVSREVNAMYHDLGATAFRASRISEGYRYSAGFDDMVTHHTDEYKRTPYDFRREIVNNVWRNPSYFASGIYEPRDASSPKGDSRHSTTEEPLTVVPESDEVRAHRTKEKIEQAEIDAHAENDRRNINKASDAIFDAAKDLYDVPDLGGLDDKQLRKVERKVQSQLHPDRGFDNGGDIGAFKEAGNLMGKIRQQNAASSGDKKSAN